MALAPTCVSVNPSVSCRVKIPPTAPANVTSRPSRIQVAPSETTISQCHELHGIRSNRAGIYDSILSPFAMLPVFRANKRATQKCDFGLPKRCSHGPVGRPDVQTALRSTGHRPVATTTFVKSLIDHFDRIAFVQHAFYHDRTLNTGHALVSLRYFLQYFWRFLASIGIKCDHHAACIAFQDPDDDFRPDLQRSTDKFIFGESATGS